MKPPHRTPIAVPLFSAATIGSYVDTVAVVLPRRMPKDGFRQLRQALVSCLREGTQRGSYVLHKHFWPGQRRYWWFVMYVHQPTRSALEVLLQHQYQMGLRVLEVHVALDIGTDSYTDASSLQAWVEERFLPCRRNSKTVQTCHSTTYYNDKAKPGTPLALYADRPSKTNGQPCLHIEWRVIKSAALAGNRLKLVEDVIGLDHREFWRERLRLVRPPRQDEVVNAVMRRRGSRSLEEAQNLVRGLFQLARHPRGHVVAKSLLVELRAWKSHLGRCHEALFEPLPVGWLLPCSENMLFGREGLPRDGPADEEVTGLQSTGSAAMARHVDGRS